MPYVLSNLVDGRRPSAAYVRPDYQAKPGEVVVSDQSWESTPNDWVWDAASQQMRAPTAAELLTRAKAEKERAIRDAADNELTQETRASEREIVVFKAASGGALSVEEQQIRTNMSNNYNAMKAKVVAVRAATTLAEVEAVTWP